MSRIYLKSTVVLTAVFILCVANIALAQEPCGSWSFSGWIQSGHSAMDNGRQRRSGAVG
jgi:hypothetical protein